MKKKLLISTLVVILILSMSMAMLVGCKHDVDFGEQKIGTTAPDIEATPITSDMTAFEMLEIGVENYYNADVAVSSYNGSVVTKVAGLNVTQLVESIKIRVGKGDEGGNNENGASYFADSKSSGVAKLYEKMVITPDEVKYKNAKSGIGKDKNTGEWSASKWNGETTFGEVEELADAKDNNPTILWMYNLKEEYILKDSENTTAPELTKDGYYTFSLDFDPVKSTENYIDTMKAQLEGNAGMKVSGLEFRTLRLKVEIWENGAIKRIYITESYKMVIASIINSVITLNSDTQYAYEEIEGYKLAEHVKAF